MPNKQKIPPQTARDRLALISHHFLSDDETDSKEKSEESGQASPLPGTYNIALLQKVHKSEELPLFLLCRQLATHGHSSTIHDCATGMNMVSFASRNKSRKIRTPHHGLPYYNEDTPDQGKNNKAHDVCFYLIDSTDAPQLLQADKVLLTASASTEGLQQAYRSIKKLLTVHNTIRIGIIITGTSDVTVARNAFSSIAQAVQPFMEYDLLNSGYLSPASDISKQTTTDSFPTSIDRSDIAAIAEIINNEINNKEVQNCQPYNKRLKKQTKPATNNKTADPNLKTLTIHSDDDLLKLVTRALPELLGNACELVSSDLPFDGCHILALNARKQPVIISSNRFDGGSALLSGLAILDRLSENREMIKRLYPGVFNRPDQSVTVIDDTHLIVLAPAPVPGCMYLSHTHRNLSFFIFHPLQLDQKAGLLIEPCFT